jgi:radical SAM protein with 4Fe4S-binding SPASM domain
MQNVQNIIELAQFVKDRGWHDSNNFSAYVSPVTDHGSIGGYETPKDEADLLLALLTEVEKYPLIQEVFDVRHFRGFNYVERILLDGKPRFPATHRCEAILGMYIFDPRGDVHVCLEAVGDPSLRVGIYDPEFILEKDSWERWTQRNVLKLNDCKKCKIRFICAGGCTMDAFNHNELNSSRCMPFLREIDIAWQYYGRNRPELFN